MLFLSPPPRLRSGQLPRSHCRCLASASRRLRPRARRSTQPPRRSGRGKKLQPTPVHQAAERLGIEVRHPASLKSQEEKDAFAALEADVGVVAAYGLILPQAVLDAPTHGCLNVHASILPRWRGAAPIQRAILAGDTGTGVTIMQMEAGLDTGPMLATIRTPIDRKTAGELTDELADKGAQLMVGTLRELSKHIPVAQDDAEATHAPKIDKAEARLDWSQEAEQGERVDAVIKSAAVESAVTWQVSYYLISIALWSSLYNNRHYRYAEKSRI